MAKETFDKSLDEMLELDAGLDVNSLLDSIPALETEEKPPLEEEGDDGKNKNDSKVSLTDINKVLDQKDLEDSNTKPVEDLKEKKDDTPVSLDKPTGDNTSDASFTVIFARDLVGQGLLSSFDEEEFLKNVKEVGEADALRALIKSEIEENISAAKTDLDAGYQEYLRVVGKGVPVETATSLIELKTKFDNIKLDDLTNEENTNLRKQVMVDYFKLTTSMSDAKIERMVQNSIDLGDDMEDSKEYLAVLKKSISEELTFEEEKAQKQSELNREENRRSMETLKENINSLNEIIPGVAINKQTKVQMFEAITKPVQDSKGRTTNAIWAKRSEDPMFFDERMAYLLSTGYFEKGKPWTKATLAKTTKEISELEKVIKNRNNTGSITGSPVLRLAEQDKTTKDNIDSMRGIFTK